MSNRDDYTHPNPDREFVLPIGFRNIMAFIFTWAVIIRLITAMAEVIINGAS